MESTRIAGEYARGTNTWPLRPGRLWGGESFGNGGARDLYTSSYFAVKRQYAEAAVQWAGTADRRANAWAILSAEHAVLPPRLEVDPYDTTIDDLGGQPITGEPAYELPSGEPVETELDRWAMRVHSVLGSWLRRPFAADQEESPCRELVVLAGSDYVDALREGDIFSGRPTAIRTGRQTHRALPPKATIRFPFKERDFDGMFEQMAGLSERIEDLSEAAAPARRAELSTFEGGYEREDAPWQTAYGGIDIEGTEQASLETFEDVDDRFRATKQTRLGTGWDGGIDAFEVSILCRNTERSCSHSKYTTICEYVFY